MKSPLPAPTKAEAERFSYFREIGCIPCHQLGYYNEPDAHHQLSGSHRISHSDTVPACPWHHRGIPPGGVTQRQATALLGPSMATEPRRFREVFGSDEHQLQQTNLRYEALRSQRVGVASCPAE